MSEPLLICSDMDRTLLPNGVARESPGARPGFARLAAMPAVSIAYVTGRHLSLALNAIRSWRVPLPDFLVCDVGTSIHSLENGRWHAWENWWEHIGEDWRGRNHGDLAELFADLAALELQEKARQGRYKLSYITESQASAAGLVETMEGRLKSQGINARVIWSRDEASANGLVDVVPARATKRHAVEFLMVASGAGYERTIFAGDGSAELEVLASPVHSILVANAADEVRKEALLRAGEEGQLDTLYIAKGGYLGMNGNYAAGILEGVTRRYPESRDWLETMCGQTQVAVAEGGEVT